jgi:glucose/arabinose dehydrogenase
VIGAAVVGLAMIGASVTVGATWLVVTGGAVEDSAEDGGATALDPALEAPLAAPGVVEPDRLSDEPADEVTPADEDPSDDVPGGVLVEVPVGAEVQAASSIVTATSTAPTATDAPIIASPSSTAPITAVTVTGTIATGLTTPWGLGFLPDGTALVTERDTGKLLAIAAGSGHAVRTVGTVTGVVPGGEGGLLGLAVDPKAATPTVYVYYTASGDNRIARLNLNTGATKITGQRDILTGIPKASVHNGGRIAIGPDGDLYIGTGDATDSDRAQQLDYLGGKILRITLDGEPAPGNPFRNAPLVYSYGHRNVQGLAFDARGRLWASEFGQSAYDEQNLIKPGGNYGWPIVEGPSDNPKFVAPYKYWPTSDASPSGLAVVGETAFMAALRGTRLWLIPLSGSPGATTPKAQLTGTYGRLRTVVVAPDGSLWLTTSNTDGRGDPKPGDDRILQLRTD